jgi:hypothetical protein
MIRFFLRFIASDSPESGETGHRFGLNELLLVDLWGFMTKKPPHPQPIRFVVSKTAALEV